MHFSLPLWWVVMGTCTVRLNNGSLLAIPRDLPHLTCAFSCHRGPVQTPVRLSSCTCQWHRLQDHPYAGTRHSHDSSYGRTASKKDYGMPQLNPETFKAWLQLHWQASLEKISSKGTNVSSIAARVQIDLLWPSPSHGVSISGGPVSG